MAAQQYGAGVGDERIGKLNAAGMPAVEKATGRDRGAGPFGRLVLRGATIIDGTGAPPWSPADIVIENGRIAAIEKVGLPRRLSPDALRPPAGDHMRSTAAASTSRPASSTATAMSARPTTRCRGRWRRRTTSTSCGWPTASPPCATWAA